jgi:hypothetical protein
MGRGEAGIETGLAPMIREFESDCPAIATSTVGGVVTHSNEITDGIIRGSVRNPPPNAVKP